ncbi:hypothetical protein D3C85_1080350 [compost metagenome]
MLLDKAADARREPARGEGRHGADGQPLVAVAGLEHTRGIGDLQQRVAHALGVDPAVGGQHHPLAAPLEQRLAQFFLQRADLVADGAMGDEQLRRRAGKALVARGGLEGAQRGERRQAREIALPALSVVGVPAAAPDHDASSLCEFG